jgi:hypothetical protein
VSSWGENNDLPANLLSLLDFVAYLETTVKLSVIDDMMTNSLNSPMKRPFAHFVQQNSSEINHVGK